MGRTLPIFFVTTLCLLSLQPQMAKGEGCKLTRTLSPCSGESCAEIARKDFAQHAEEQTACGVIPECLPTILNAKTKEGQQAKGTVVLVHGLTASPSHMKQIAERLQKEGYNVVLPILSGHGGEDNLLTRASLSAWRKDVGYAGEIAKRLGEPLYLIGHSTGGVMSGLEAAAHPGRYKAVVGLDPALNLDGERAIAFENICIGSKLWRFPRNLPLTMQNPDEVVNIPDLGECMLPRGAGRDAIRALEDIKVERIVGKFCGKDFVVPHFNYEFSLAALCALKNATFDMNARKMARLPPSLLVLSKDEDVFGYISRDKMIKAISANPQNKVLETEAPYHGLMVANCSPGFEKYTQEILSWLEQHKTTPSPKSDGNN